MPRIPLFNQGAQPPSRAPRVRTPLAPTSPVRIAMGNIDGGMIANFSSEPEANARPWLRQGQATAQFGEAIQQAGDVLNKLAMAKAETINRLDLAEGESAMAREFAGFEKWKQETNADPREWGAEWERRSEGLEKLAITDRMSPVVKERLAESILRFRARSSITVESEATRKLFEMDGERIRAQVITAADNLDLPGAYAAIEEGQSTGVIAADDAARMSINAREQVKAKKREEAEGAIADIIAMDPQTAMDALNGSDEEIAALIPHAEELTPADKNQFGRAAEVEQNRRRSRTFDMLLDETVQGRTLSPNAVKMLVDDGKLGAQDAERYLSYVQERNPSPEDPDRVVSVIEAIDNYNPDMDPTGEQILAIQGQMLGFSKMRTQWLRDRMRRREEEASGLVPSHPHAGTARQGVYQALARGFFGPLTKTVKEQEPMLDAQGNAIEAWKLKEVYDSEKLKAARIAQARALDTLDKWLSDPANATKSRAEVEAFAQSLLPRAPGLGAGAGSILGEDEEDPEGSLNSLLDNPLFSE